MHSYFRRLFFAMTAWLSLFAMAWADDYTQGVIHNATAGTATVWFKPATPSNWVDLHYLKGTAGQNNVRMTYQAASGRHEYVIGGAVAGEKLDYFFTYSNAAGNAANDSAWVRTTVSNSSSGSGGGTGGGTGSTSGLTIKIVNNSGLAANRIYWAIIGQHPTNLAFSYVDRNGNLKPMALADNSQAAPSPSYDGDIRKYPVQYFTKLSEASTVTLPEIRGGRLYFSIDTPMFMEVNKDINNLIGYAGPNMNNPTDPNLKVVFDWVEFAKLGKGFWGNNTRVDQYGFPTTTQIKRADGSVEVFGDKLDLTRDAVFNAFASSVPAQFAGLRKLTASGEFLRILAPAKDSFGADHKNGQWVPRANGTYYDAYVTQVWDYYRTHTLKFVTNEGTFSGRVQPDDRFLFTHQATGATYSIPKKPSTQEVLEPGHSEVLAVGSELDKVVQKIVAAALNRHILPAPAELLDWRDVSKYYPAGSVANWYAQFWHPRSIGDKAYGFAYDDVAEQSSSHTHIEGKEVVEFTVTLNRWH